MKTLKCPLRQKDLDYALSCRVYIKCDQPKRFKRLPKPKYKYVALLSETEESTEEEKLLPEQNSNNKVAEKDKLLRKTNNTSHNLPTSEDIKTKRPRGRPRKMSSRYQNYFENYVKQKSSESIQKNALAKNVIKTKQPTPIRHQQQKKKASSELLNQKMSDVAKKSENYEDSVYYYLDMASELVQYTKHLPQLDYPFDDFIKDVKFMKLPNSDWKIKIMVHKQKMICASFNYSIKPCEKNVMIHKRTLNCELKLRDKRISLIGCPLTLTTIEDVEILLNIMHSLTDTSTFYEFLE